MWRDRDRREETVQPQRRRSFSLGTAAVSAGAPESELTRHLNEMNFRETSKRCVTRASKGAAVGGGAPSLPIRTVGPGRRRLRVEPLRYEAGKAKCCHPANVTEEVSAGVFGLGSGIGHVFLEHGANAHRYMGATA